MKTLITRAFKMTPQERSLLEGIGLDITFWADEHAEVPDPGQYEAKKGLIESPKARAEKKTSNNN